MSKNILSVEQAVAAVENFITAGRNDFIVHIDGVGAVMFSVNNEDYEPCTSTLVDAIGTILKEWKDACPDLPKAFVNSIIDNDVRMLVTMANMPNDNLLVHYKCIEAVYSALFAHERKEVGIDLDDLDLFDESVIDLAMMNHRTAYEHRGVATICDEYDELKEAYLKDHFGWIVRNNPHVKFLVDEMFGKRLDAACSLYKELKSGFKGSDEEWNFHAVLEALKIECIIKE